MPTRSSKDIKHIDSPFSEHKIVNLHLHLAETLQYFYRYVFHIQRWNRIKGKERNLSLRWRSLSKESISWISLTSFLEDSMPNWCCNIIWEFTNFQAFFTFSIWLILSSNSNLISISIFLNFSLLIPLFDPYLSITREIFWKNQKIKKKKIFFFLVLGKNPPCFF